MFTNSQGYSFQGQEHDDEVKGKGNSINYKYRMHDPRIGRFFAVDPLAPSYPELTPYQFSHNSPIYMQELEGLEGKLFHYSVWTENGTQMQKQTWIETLDGDRGGLFNASPHVAYPYADVVEFNYRQYHYYEGETKPNSSSGWQIIKTGPYGTATVANSFVHKVEKFYSDNNTPGVIHLSVGGDLYTSELSYEVYERWIAPYNAAMEAKAAAAPPRDYSGRLQWVSFEEYLIPGSFGGKKLMTGILKKVATKTMIRKRIALGVREHLDDFAVKVEGQTWKKWGVDDFETGFMKQISDPDVDIHFNLDGIDNVWSAAQKGAQGPQKGGFTNWELFQLKSNEDALKRTIFYENGVEVANPFN